MDIYGVLKHQSKMTNQEIAAMNFMTNNMFSMNLPVIDFFHKMKTQVLWKEIGQ